MLARLLRCLHLAPSPSCCPVHLRYDLSVDVPTATGTLAHDTPPTSEVHPSLKSQWALVSGDHTHNPAEFPSGTITATATATAATTPAAPIVVVVVVAVVVVAAAAAAAAAVPVCTSFRSVSPAFPGFLSGLLDVNGQQLDLRTKNSWLLKLGARPCPPPPFRLSMFSLVTCNAVPSLLRSCELPVFVAVQMKSRHPRLLKRF
jgi:hypothetical protein